MKTATRKWAGGVLLAGSVVGAVILPLCGVSLVSMEVSSAHRESNGNFIWMGGFQLHLPLIVLGGSALLGLFFLLSRGGKGAKSD